MKIEAKARLLAYAGSLKNEISEAIRKQATLNKEWDSAYKNKAKNPSKFKEIEQQLNALRSKITELKKQAEASHDEEALELFTY